MFDLVPYLSKVSLNYDVTVRLVGAGLIIIFQIQLEVDVSNYDIFDMAIK